MVDPYTAKEIEKISYDILRSSKAWGKYPTRVDAVVACSDLILSKQIDISDIHQSYISRKTDSLIRALAKVRGIFDRSQKTIYIDSLMNPGKKNFVKLHETAHGLLPWQNASNAFLDDDSTLNAACREQFEVEANYFASITLFQLDRFREEMAKLEFGIKSAIYMAKMFGGSNHAAIRKYVECSPKRCALLVLEPLDRESMAIECGYRDFFASPRFINDFGDLSPVVPRFAIVKTDYFSGAVNNLNKANPAKHSAAVVT